MLEKIWVQLEVNLDQKSIDKAISDLDKFAKDTKSVLSNNVDITPKVKLTWLDKEYNRITERIKEQITQLQLLWKSTTWLDNLLVKAQKLNKEFKDKTIWLKEYWKELWKINSNWKIAWSSFDFLKTKAWSFLETLWKFFVVREVWTWLKDLWVSMLVAWDNLEQSTISFTTMLWSAERAKSLLKDLSDFAIETPFELQGIRDTAKQLLAVWIETEKLIPTMKSLWDISALLGWPDIFWRLTYALWQVKTAWKLTWNELRQFTEAWVDLLTPLSESMWLTTQTIREMISEWKIGFPEVEKALRNLTEEGWRFENWMAAQVDTLSWKYSKLKDQINQMFEQQSWVDEESSIYWQAKKFLDYLSENIPTINTALKYTIIWVQLVATSFTNVLNIWQIVFDSLVFAVKKLTSTWIELWLSLSWTFDSIVTGAKKAYNTFKWYISWFDSESANEKLDKEFEDREKERSDMITTLNEEKISQDKEYTDKVKWNLEDMSKATESFFDNKEKLLKEDTKVQETWVLDMEYFKERLAKKEALDLAKKLENIEKEQNAYDKLRKEIESTYKSSNKLENLKLEDTSQTNISDLQRTKRDIQSEIDWLYKDLENADSIASKKTIENQIKLLVKKQELADQEIQIQQDIVSKNYRLREKELNDEIATLEKKKQFQIDLWNIWKADIRQQQINWFKARLEELKLEEYLVVDKRKLAISEKQKEIDDLLKLEEDKYSKLEKMEKKFTAKIQLSSNFSRDFLGWNSFSAYRSALLSKWNIYNTDLWKWSSSNWKSWVTIWTVNVTDNVWLESFSRKIEK